MNIHISTREVGNFTVVDIKGEINIEHVKEFESTLNKLIDQGKQHIALNFSKVRYLCSHSISVLVRVWKNVVEQNGSLRTISTDPEIIHLLMASNLDRIMPVYSSEKAFLQEIGKKEALVHLECRKSGQYQIIDVTRPISIVSGYMEMNEKVRTLIDKGEKFIAFNLCSVGYIYSEMAGLLSKWNNQLKRVGGQLCLIGLAPELKQRLCLMGFDRIIPIYNTEKDIP